MSGVLSSGIVVSPPLPLPRYMTFGDKMGNSVDRI
jgi:hypothetical protein